MLTLAASAGADASGLRLFDAHLHYTGVDAASLSPRDILGILDRAGISRAVVTGVPTRVVERLYQAAPTRIIPFLGVYSGGSTKGDWMHDASLPARVARALDAAAGIYRGIGELHIFEPDAQSPVLMALADLAAERNLMLQLHGDAAVIDAVFARQPGLTVLWAHLGTDPRPEAIAAVLARHPRLYADTSVRDGRFVDEQGRIRPEWHGFFVQHAERIVVGVDTYWTRRWLQMHQVADQIRGWLGQLPPAVAERIAHRNAESLFGPASRPDKGIPQTASMGPRMVLAPIECTPYARAAPSLRGGAMHAGEGATGARARWRDTSAGRRDGARGLPIDSAVGVSYGTIEGPCD